MKKKILFDIQSQSDIITNSSTEVFILNNENGAIEELMNELLPYCKHWVDVFNTEEDVKEYLLKNFNDYYCEELHDLSEVVDFNPLVSLNDSWNFDPVKMEKYGFTKEKLVDFYNAILYELQSLADLIADRVYRQSQFVCDLFILETVTLAENEYLTAFLRQAVYSSPQTGLSM